jgi:4-aminobutyrate aminotransferase
MYGTPLILDEVQTGMGRTGKWWAFEHYDVKPDIMSIAKGLQVGAAAYDKYRFEPEESGVLSSTWGGGSRIDMAIGATIIDVIMRDRLLDNAAKVGELLKKRIEEMVGKKSGKNGVITDVRGIGLMIGIEFDSMASRNEKLQELFKNGLLILPAGQKSMRVMPPLIITEEEAEEGVEIMNQVL